MAVLRTPSQQEVDEYQKFIESNGIENTEANADRLGEPILTIGQQITQSTLKAAFDMVKGQLTYLPIKSAAEQEYDRVVRDGQLSQAALDAFDAWYVQQRLVQSGDEVYQNKSSLLLQLRGRPINRQRALEALGRVANNSTRRLHVLPEPVAESFGRHSGKTFQEQESIKLTVDNDQKWDDKATFVNGRINHAHAPRPKPEPVKPQGDDARWWSMANQLQGHTHSQTAQIRQIVGRDGRDTYEKRLKALGELSNGCGNDPGREVQISRITGQVPYQDST